MSKSASATRSMYQLVPAIEPRSRSAQPPRQGEAPFWRCSDRVRTLETEKHGDDGVSVRAAAAMIDGWGVHRVARADGTHGELVDKVASDCRASSQTASRQEGS